jgi:peptide/nickel transport system ATP-binding protein
VIFDETFSALDKTTQGHLIDLLRELRRAHEFAALFVSHDLSFLSRICKTVAVMDRGRIVEQTSMERLLVSPGHPCSRELAEAMPRLPPEYPIPQRSNEGCMT